MHVTIANLAIRNGFANDGNGGGGVLIQFGQVAMTNVNVSDNTSVIGGGGIENDLSQLTLANSTVIRNQSSEAGAGISSISAGLTILNSTVSGTSRRGLSVISSGVERFCARS